MKVNLSCLKVSGAFEVADSLIIFAIVSCHNAAQVVGLIRFSDLVKKLAGSFRYIYQQLAGIGW